MLSRSENCDALFGALAKAQAEIGVAVFDSENPHFRSKYASLSAVREVIKEPFAKHSLSVSQWLNGEGQDITLTTVLSHSSGQYIQSSFPLLLQKRDMQGLGSATTYARRYALAALAFVVSDDDDDGNESMKQNDWSRHEPISRPKEYPPSKPKPAPKATAVSSEPFETHAPSEHIEQDLSDLANYVVPIGTKYKGKRLGEIPHHELKGYYDYFSAQRASGKKIANNMVDVLVAIEKYLESEPPQQSEELPF